jgi:cell division protein FtsA
MMFSNKSKNKAGVATRLAVDIGTEFIKTVLFIVNEGVVEVIGYDRAPQRPNAMRGALIINLEEVIDVVDVSIGKVIQMAEHILDEAVKAPTHVILGIAGELVKGVPIVVNVERDKPNQKITEVEIDRILEQIRQETFESALEEIAYDTGIQTSQIQEIDTIVNSVYIDGVKVDSPFGFSGKDLVYRVFSTFAPKIHLDSIKQVAKALGLRIDRVVVEPYALALALEKSKRENFSGIFIDIGGGTTDIALVDQGAIAGTKMFALGGRVFTKRLQLDLNLPYHEAERMKIDYTDQKLTEFESKQVRQAVEKDMPIWLDGVEISLAEFNEIDRFPSQIYLCGGGTLLPEIQQKLLAHPWIQVLPFGKFPRVEYLFPNQVANVIDRTKKATHQVDVTPLALARMALD